MPASDIHIRFAADTTDLVRGVSEVVAAVQAIGPKIGSVGPSVEGVGPKIEAIGKSFKGLGETLKGGLDGLEKIKSAFAKAGAEGGPRLDSLVASTRNVSSALVELGRNGAARLQSFSESASQLSVHLSSAAAEGAGKLAALGEAASGVAGVAMALGEVALSAAGGLAEWAAATVQSSTASEEAKTNAANLNGAIADAQTAFSGVVDTLANAFAPIMTTIVDALTQLADGFVQSYKEGGTAKQVVDALGIVFKVLAGIVEVAVGVIVAVIQGLCTEIQLFKDGFELAKDLVTAAIGQLELQFQTLGAVIRDVLSGKWSQAVSDYKAGLAQMATQTRATVNQINQDLARIGTDASTGVDQVSHTIGGFGQALGSLAKGSASHHNGGNGNPSHPPRGSGGGGARTPAPKTHDCPDAAAAAECVTRVQAVNVSTAETGHAELIQSAVDTNVQLMTIDQLGADAYVAGQKASVDAAQDADHKVVQSHAQATQALQRQNQQLQQQASASFHAWVDPMVSAFAKGVQGMIAGTTSLRQAMAQVGNAILQTFMQTMQRVVANWIVQHVLMRLFAIGTQDAVLANHVLVESEKTVATVAGATTRVGVQAATSLKTIAISAVTALKQIAHQAAVAAGAVWASISQMGPAGVFMAPVMAAAALAGVMALGKSISSAAGGWGEVPADGMLTQLHRKEMVLPADIAEPLRGGLRSGLGATGLALRSGFGAPANDWASNDNGGDTHHHWNVSAVDARSFERYLRGPAGQVMVKELFARHRAGAAVGVR